METVEWMDMVIDLELFDSSTPITVDSLGTEDLLINTIRYSHRGI